MLTEQRLCPGEAYLHMDEVSTQTRFSSGPAGEEKSKVMKRYKDGGSNGQGGRKGLEESRKLDSRELVKLIAG